MIRRWSHPSRATTTAAAILITAVLLLVSPSAAVADALRPVIGVAFVPLSTLPKPRSACSRRAGGTRDRGIGASNKPGDETSPAASFSPFAEIFRRSPFGPPSEPGEQDGDTTPEPMFDVSTLKASTEPKTFGVTPGLLIDLVGAFFPFLIRAGSGAFADGYGLSITERDESRYSVLRLGSYQLEESCSPSAAGKRPALPIILYEFEACPFCRKVREACTILSLEVNYKPCPKGGTKFRRRVKRKYGDVATFPFMIDPNTGIRMFESDDIITYLFKTYGDREVPGTLTGGAVTALTAGLGLLPRLGKGGTYRRTSVGSPPEKLRLWAYESSPFCKLVREELCELQLEHVQVSCPRGSPNRQRLYDLTGRFQAPYLEDPNSGVKLFESAAILEYLGTMYGLENTRIKYM